VVAVDGPTGSGKGALCHRLSTVLGFHLLDSGALYRLTGLAARRAGIGLHDVASVAKVARNLDARFVVGSGDPPVQAWLGDDYVDLAIRSESAGADASEVAAIPAVREALLALQHDFRRPPGLVADGRDMGTTVFPDAAVKIYLTASAEARARRRHNQLIAKGIGVSLSDLLADIEVRDRRDRGRSASPLKPADDAVVIDTTDVTLDDVFEEVMGIIVARGVTSRDVVPPGHWSKRRL
jgi:cytidylate kinase